MEPVIQLQSMTPSRLEENAVNTSHVLNGSQQERWGTIARGAQLECPRILLRIMLS